MSIIHKYIGEGRVLCGAPAPHSSVDDWQSVGASPAVNCPVCLTLRVPDDPHVATHTVGTLRVRGGECNEIKTIHLQPTQRYEVVQSIDMWQAEQPPAWWKFWRRKERLAYLAEVRMNELAYQKFSGVVDAYDTAIEGECDHSRIAVLKKLRAGFMEDNK